MVVRATNFALLDFGFNGFPLPCTVNHFGNVRNLYPSYVVKLQNSLIRFATVNAWMVFQISRGFRLILSTNPHASSSYICTVFGSVRVVPLCLRYRFLFFCLHFSLHDRDVGGDRGTPNQCTYKIGPSDWIRTSICSLRRRAPV